MDERAQVGGVSTVFPAGASGHRSSAVAGEPPLVHVPVSQRALRQHLELREGHPLRSSPGAAGGGAPGAGGERHGRRRMRTPLAPSLPLAPQLRGALLEQRALPAGAGGTWPWRGSGRPEYSCVASLRVVSATTPSPSSGPCAASRTRTAGAWRGWWPTYMSRRDSRARRRWAAARLLGQPFLCLRFRRRRRGP